MLIVTGASFLTIVAVGGTCNEARSAQGVELINILQIAPQGGRANESVKRALYTEEILTSFPYALLLAAWEHLGQLALGLGCLMRFVWFSEEHGGGVGCALILGSPLV